MPVSLGPKTEVSEQDVFRQAGEIKSYARLHRLKQLKVGVLVNLPLMHITK
jgi:hypothetical protein